MNFLTKTIVFIVCCILSLNALGEPVAMFTVRVTDQSGAVVSNAVVDAGFVESIKPGWGWGGGKERIWKGKTDEKGLCVVKESCQEEAGVAVGKDGYYWSSGYKLHFTNIVGVIMQQWQPWNPTLEVVLKKIGNPIPMYARWVYDLMIPAVDQNIGFDLEKSDWVAPYGKGEVSDLIFKLERKLGGKTKSGFQIHDTTLTISFSNAGDGIQSILVPPRNGRSELRLPAVAPEGGYLMNVVKRKYREDGKPSFSDVREDQNYLFRVRTKKDENGNIVSALYGKIHGDFEDFDRGKLSFRYYLNPTPNDRNLEFDPNKNLFKNLKSGEEVREP